MQDVAILGAEITQLQLTLVAKEAEIEAMKWRLELYRKQHPNHYGPCYIREWQPDQQAQFIRNAFNTVGIELTENNFAMVDYFINGSE